MGVKQNYVRCKKCYKHTTLKSCLDVKYKKTKDDKHAFFSTYCLNCCHHDNIMRLTSEENEEQFIIILAEQ
jgi:ribosomal protein S26